MVGPSVLYAMRPIPASARPAATPSRPGRLPRPWATTTRTATRRSTTPWCAWLPPWSLRYPLVDSARAAGSPGNDHEVHRSPADPAMMEAEGNDEGTAIIPATTTAGKSRRLPSRFPQPAGQRSGGIAVGAWQPISRRTTCVSWPTRCSGRWRITTPTKRTLAAVRRLKAWTSRPAGRSDPRAPLMPTKLAAAHPNGASCEVDEDSPRSPAGDSPELEPHRGPEPRTQNLITSGRRTGSETASYRHFNIEDQSSDRRFLSSSRSPRCGGQGGDQ